MVTAIIMEAIVVVEGISIMVVMEATALDILDQEGVIIEVDGKKFFFFIKVFVVYQEVVLISLY